MVALNHNQMKTISAGAGDLVCLAAVGGAMATGGWAGLKAGAKLGGLLAWTGLGAGTITIGVGVVASVGAGLLAYSRCDD